MNDIDRAAWFRARLYFVSYGRIDRRSLWSSWSDWCVEHRLEPGSKSAMWRWLNAIGAKQDERWGNCIFTRIKFLS